MELHNQTFNLIRDSSLGGDKLIADGALSLKKLQAKIDTAKMNSPSFLLVLTGTGDFPYTREDGVLVVPVGCLGL